MQHETIIGTHKGCGGDLEAWSDSGHYYYYSGVHCLKCKRNWEEAECALKHVHVPDDRDYSYVRMAEK